MSGRYVQTVYGPMPGCPDCGRVLLSGGPMLCEHGVTPAAETEVSFTLTLRAEDYFRLFYGGEA